MDSEGAPASGGEAIGERLERAFPKKLHEGRAGHNLVALHFPALPVLALLFHPFSPARQFRAEGMLAANPQLELFPSRNDEVIQPIIKL